MIARELCHTHYKRWQVHGDPLKNNHRKFCSIESCGKKHNSNGYCAMHKMRLKRYGNVNTVLCARGKYKNFLDGYEDQVIRNTEDCWGWSGNISKAGYATICSSGKTMFAHRIAYENFVGELLDNHEICHKCDNPICSRPDHLFQGTHKENIHDCIKKGRFKRAPDESKVKGEEHGTAKLSSQDVIEIKRKIALGLGNQEIAKDYPVTHKNISSIRVGKTWKHIQCTS